MDNDEKKLLKSIKAQLNKTEKRLNSIDVTLIKQEINLDTHMKRTELNEQRLEIFEERIGPALDAYKFVATAFKILVGVAAIVGAYMKWAK
jgi:2C-methyl-D-erythritol 2,4-cyclodiphosphate synthase